MKRPSPRRAGTPAPSPRSPAAFPPLQGGWLAAIATVAAAVVLAAVTVPIRDMGVGQHLAVGKALFQGHGIPRTDLWTWPGYGTPYPLTSWLFRAALWPFWAASGVAGLEAWRWLTTLAAFALLWRTARRSGATGAAPLLMLVWCALFYRLRSDLRPDTLVAVLLAAQLWMLETRRTGGRVHAAWLVAIGWVWVNADDSFPLFFVVGIAYLLDAAWRSVRREHGSHEQPRALALALVAALAAAFLNPFGFAALARPFAFVLQGRHAPIVQYLVELRPLVWGDNVRNGLAAFLLVAATLAVLRARRAGPDLAQWLLVPALAIATATAQGCIGWFAIAAAPFAARDLAAVLAGVRWPAPLSAPRARVVLVGALCVAGALPELLRPDRPLGTGLDPNAYPVAACDWIAKHDVRGRGFNDFTQGGYLLWRFWPQRDRLPFMDVQRTGTALDRDLYTRAWGDSSAWARLDAERHFDWALVPRLQGPGRRLMDYLDADADWALVFADDVAALYLRRNGAQAATASREAYQWVPGGDARITRMARAVEVDGEVRDVVRAELARMIADSPRCGQAHSQLANLEGLDERWEHVIDELEIARRINPGLPRITEREQLAHDHLLGVRPDR